jgi:pantetheine-phosphate adenylyltransferase
MCYEMRVAASRFSIAHCRPATIFSRRVPSARKFQGKASLTVDYSDCQKKRSDWGRFFAAITYAAILLSEHYYDKRYNQRINQTMKRTAIYPGSFDPVTNGHLDIIERGLKIFDKIIVAILHNPNKTSLFTVEERLSMLKASLKRFTNVEIDTFDGLTVDYAAEKKASGILRGLRAMSDFEYEFQMALMNRKLNREIQTIYLMTGLRWIYTSSSIIKEAARFGGDINGMVPPVVLRKIKKKFAEIGGPVRQKSAPKT